MLKITPGLIVYQNVIREIEQKTRKCYDYGTIENETEGLGVKEMGRKGGRTKFKMQN